MQALPSVCGSPLRGYVARLFAQDQARDKYSADVPRQQFETDSRPGFEPLEPRLLLSASPFDLTSTPLSFDVSDIHASASYANRQDSKLDGRLQQAVDRLTAISLPANASANQASAAGPIVASGLFDTGLAKTNEQGQVQIVAHLSEWDQNTTSRLSDLGLKVEVAHDSTKRVQGWASPEAIDRLATLSTVKKLTLPSYATFSAGNTLTAGDAILNADDVRAQLGYDGTGVRIGVISSGVDHWQNISATGDLPAVITIDPIRSGFNSDLSFINDDEGTAMLEIVHDLAPGAELYFSGPKPAANPNDPLQHIFTAMDMVDSINWLVGQGVDIIVDDVGFFDEPYFEDGIVAQAANNALSQGVVYVTSSGNQAQDHYQAQYSLGGSSGAGNWHQFSLGDDFMGIGIDAGATISVTLQWSDAFGASGNNYDIYLLGASGIVQSSTLGQSGNDDPFEGFSYTNTGSSGVFFLGINQLPGAASRELELFVRNDSGQEYFDASDGIFGHAAADGVIAVGAIDAADPGNDDIEWFSSRGSSTIYTNFATQTSITRDSLDGASIDGVDTQVGISGLWSGGNPFFGTSAAAPHAAAIAGLILQANPLMTPAAVTSLLTSTAVDLLTPGYDADSGFGRFDALQAIQGIVANADFDANGLVDNADLAIFSGNFGITSGATHSMGDADYDGDVDGLDLEAWTLQDASGGAPLVFDGDFDNNGNVDMADFLVLQENLGMSSATNADGDVNNDGLVDGKDLVAYEFAHELANPQSSTFITVEAVDIAKSRQPGQILVSTLTDGVDNDYRLGQLTLREALIIAGQTTADDTIVYFEQGSINLLGTELLIDSNVTIVGVGGAEATIQAPTDSRVISVAAGATVTISATYITGGNLETGDGGGIHNAGTLTLEDITVTGNLAKRGGGIYNANTGILIVQHGGGFFSNNAGIDSIIVGEGGGIYNAGVLTIPNRSFVTGNATSGKGAGIYNLGTANLTDAWVTDNNASDTSSADGGGIYNDLGAILTATDASIKGNTANGGDGAGIHNLGTVNLTNTGVSNNTLTGTGFGGGISNSGTLTLTNVDMTGNQAPHGGGVHNAGLMTITGGTTITGNIANGSAGGILNFGGDLDIIDAVISNNTATAGYGGGIYNFSGTLSVDTGLISTNSAVTGLGGGIYNFSGGITVTDSTIDSNIGAGIYLNTGSLDVSRSTISKNTGSGVSSGYTAGLQTYSNVTVSGNDGDGIAWAGGSGLTLVNSTITDNDGRGLKSEFSGAVIAHNSIIAGNAGADIYRIVNGTYNLIGTSDQSGGSSVLTDTITNQVLGELGGLSDYGLAPLGDYGGPTKTHALLANSTAIDMGDSGLAAAADQRGLTRVLGTQVDIGAYESGNTTPLAVTTAADELDPTDVFLGDGLSLREALQLSRDIVGPETITFDPTIGSTITLSRGELLIEDDVNIQGLGADQLTVSGGSLSRVFRLNSGVTASISGLTIADGNVSGGNGGGIFNSGQLTLDAVEVRDNTASAGGGIYQWSNQGATLDVLNSTIADNDGGGGIYLAYGGQGVVNITNSTISTNTGAGFYWSGGGSAGIIFTNATVTNNTSYGIHSEFGAGPTLHNSIVVGNGTTSGYDLYRLFNSASSFNLIGTQSQGGLTDQVNNNRVGVTAAQVGLSMTLANNGGPTRTHALIAGGLAIDSGDNSFAPLLGLWDQRGDPFSRLVDGDADLIDEIDIGAYEFVA